MGLFFFLCGRLSQASTETRYHWLMDPAVETIKTEIKPPMGYFRVSLPDGSFGAWLRELPLHPGSPPVHLYNGQKKQNQFAHHHVPFLENKVADCHGQESGHETA